MSLRETCHCGHHKDTHFKSAGACLGVMCDCAEYADDQGPKPEPVPPPPSTSPISSTPWWLRLARSGQP